MTITRDGKTYELTEAELFSAYQEQQRAFGLQDAECHCCDFNKDNGRNIRFTTDDYNYIVDCYEDDHDCNVAENNSYDGIISNFVEETFNEDDTRKEEKIKI